MSPIRSALRTFVSDTFFVDTFGDDDSFMKTGVLDSTGMLELINFMEETWHFKMQDDELTPDNLDSVTRAVAFVERKLKKSAA